MLLRKLYSVLTLFLLMLCLVLNSMSRSVQAVENSQTTPAILISASATSSENGSAPITCLLDPACSGYWSPKSQDSGINEGIYLQFQQQVLINFLEVTLSGKMNENVQFKLYLDGKSSSSNQDIKSDSEKYMENPITTASFVKPDGNRVIVFSRAGDAPIEYEPKSIFIKIDDKNQKSYSKPQVKSIRIFQQEEYPQNNNTAESLPIILPLSIKTTAVASSTLSPANAYDVSRLFDSQIDQAWATDGKKTTGINESITLKFPAQQKIHGLLIWNGYQRSDIHYKANGRVKKLEINSQTISLADKQGAQQIMLPQILETDSLTLTIKEIYKGASYQDVLISELRLLGPDGKIILPEVSPPVVNLPQKAAFILDRTYGSFFQNSLYFDVDSDQDCISSELRLRSNGTFVIYQNNINGMIEISDIIEGNWESIDQDSVRLFGKKYQTVLLTADTEYLQDLEAESKPLTPKIFQSVLRIKRYNDMNAGEQNNLLEYMLKTRGIDKNEQDDGFIIPTRISKSKPGEYRKPIFFQAPTKTEALKMLEVELKKLNPVYVQSDVYTELLIPVEIRGTCYYWD